MQGTTPLSKKGAGNCCLFHLAHSSKLLGITGREPTAVSAVHTKEEQWRRKQWRL